jgi:hypothetical protein
MSVEELAATVCEALRREGITVTLTGGACVAIWSNGKYASHDLDFIEEGPVPRRKLTQVLAALGFNPAGRHFVHADTPLFIEFPAGPLMVGNQRVERVSERDTPVGKVRLLSPTDCIKDRLAAFFHWNDRQALEQAVLVATAQGFNLSDVRRWSQSEGFEAKFGLFRQLLPPSATRKRKRGGK